MREKKEINILVGANIQKAREAAGYTQEELSELLGATPNHLSAIERGVSGISLENLCKLCVLLGVSADNLLFGQSPCDEEAYMLTRQLCSVDKKYSQQVRNALRALIALTQE
ncbi:MAG: helix-turn-helix transcriptional regulator [Oscillospiraceae bacterium]|nr:helix-turn-helix transcriptional regulator [Oscillospiraceae bacterium]